VQSPDCQHGRNAGHRPWRIVPNVTAAQLKQMLGQKDFFLVDVHVPYAGELAQTDAFIPYTDIEQNLGKLPTDKNAKILLYCSSGHMSGMAANTLIKLG
jgi:rhodanese-related sulfurtransferase